MLTRAGMVSALFIMPTMLIGSLLGRSTMLMLIFSLMAGPFVINGWICFTMLRRLNITRQIPKRTMAGNPISVNLTLQNQKFLFTSWQMSVWDRLTSSQERLDPGPFG